MTLDFLISFDPIPKSWFWKRKCHNLGFIGIKNSCSARDPVKRMKWQATDREKIFGNSDKRLITRIQKTLNINNKKIICRRSEQMPHQKMYRRQLNTLKNSVSFGNCTLKQQKHY